jgi:DNA-binding NarL/FixJ family response regulator
MKAFQVENTTEWSGNISGGLRALISDRCQIEVGGRPPTLERHCAEVARLRAKGLTGRAIAKELRIPVSTAFALISQIN